MKDWSQEVQDAQQEIDFDKNKYQIKMDTNQGSILLDLYPDVAPNHCKNIIGLSKVGYYNNLNFHRVIDGFVIQGGCPTGNGTGGPGFNVDAEFNANKHTLGVLSMARSQSPNSAGSQFFICLGDVPSLDGQYTAFGCATAESLEVVKKIGLTETGPGDQPVEAMTINSAEVITTSL